jgi:multiple sugar transport system permease protein
MTLSAKRSLTAYLFLALPLVFFLCVRLGPMLYMFAMSFTDWGLLRKAVKFIGFDNYRDIFKDPYFCRLLGTRSSTRSSAPPL